LAILVPSLHQVRALARTAKCAVNLKNIGTACGNVIADTASGGGSLGKIHSFGWQGTVLTYLSGQEALVCPEGLYAGQDLTGHVVEVTYNGNVLYDMPLKEEPLTVLVVEDEKNYRLEFEDIRPSGGDRDFNDLVLRFTELDGGGTRITYLSISAAYHFDLLRPDRSILMKDMGRYTKAGDFVDLEGGNASYGMSSISHLVNYGTRVAYVLDYQKAVANVAGLNASDNWNNWLADEGWPEFARHQGRCNILFGDNSVELHDVIRIDPMVPGALEEFWEPKD